jgi:non-heme chloroperoxidase
MKKLLLFTILIGCNVFCIAQTSAHPIFLKPKIIALSTGVSLEYVEQGNPAGTTIIFLHGFPDSYHSFDKILNQLPKQIHAIALSQRGHGNSSKPLSSYKLSHFAEDVASFIKEKKLGPVVVAGHSLGGLIAQQFALDFPHLVKGIVIISSEAALHDNPGFPELVSEIDNLTDPVPYGFVSEFQYSTVFKPVDSNSMKLYIEETLKVPAYVWKQVAHAFMEVDYTTFIQNLNIPCLIVWGDKDAMCPKKDQLILASLIKNSRFIIYKDTGHGLHWEEPQKFTKDLLEFMNQLPD